MNQYFIDNPEMILGNMEMISTRFGYDSACISDGENLEDKLESAISNIHAEVKEYELDDIGEEDNSIEADLTVRNFSYKMCIRDRCNVATPSHAQAIRLKKMSQEGTLTTDEIEDFLSEEKPNQIPKMKFNADRIRNVLPKNTCV